MIKNYTKLSAGQRNIASIYAFCFVSDRCMGEEAPYWSIKDLPRETGSKLEANVENLQRT